ncbi:hypothetical protein KEM55_005334 [Ascosphaera atra]|nr:hypothetical protein KEM55_005334 [Ascosphaera atra]
MAGSRKRRNGKKGGKKEDDNQAPGQVGGSIVDGAQSEQHAKESAAPASTEASPGQEHPSTDSPVEGKEAFAKNATTKGVLTRSAKHREEKHVRFTEKNHFASPPSYERATADPPSSEASPKDNQPQNEAQPELRIPAPSRSQSTRTLIPYVITRNFPGYDDVIGTVRPIAGGNFAVVFMHSKKMKKRSSIPAGMKSAKQHTKHRRGPPN